MHKSARALRKAYAHPVATIYRDQATKHHLMNHLLNLKIIKKMGIEQGHILA